SKLFERAAIHCRNQDVDTLYMHCLSSNKVMMHIARKAGMEIQRTIGYNAYMVQCTIEFFRTSEEHEWAPCSKTC
ncbi:MAG: hypothetical protein ACXW3B_13010, partial [Telluria sp.]